MARVTLINPADRHILLEGGDRPNLGNGYIASYLRRSGHDCEILDLNHTTESEMESKVEAFKPQYIGISFTTPLFKEAKRIANRINSAYPDVYLVAGGPHVTWRPKSEGLEVFDHIVKGEGEQAMLDIVNGKKDRVIEGRPIQDLNLIPPPARELMPIDKYQLKFYGEPALTMLTTRGCVYTCSFCSEAGTGVRSNSPEYVSKEIDQIKSRFKRKAILIYDDIFSYSPKRMRDIGEMLERDHPDISYRATTRSTMVPPKTIDWLARTGCKEVCLGIEGGSDHVLKLNNKHATVAKNEDAIRRLKQAGIKVRTYFIVGLPGEMPEDVKRTMDFAVKTDPDIAHFYAFAPWPGTPIVERAKEYGVTVYENQDFNYLQAGKGQVEVYVETPQMTREQIRENLLWAQDTWQKHKGGIKGALDQTLYESSEAYIPMN